MNKMKQILVAAGMIALSGNAAAIPMTWDYDDYTPYIQGVIDGDFNQTSRDTRRSAKVARTQIKLDKVVVKLEASTPSNKKERKKERKMNRRVPRLETKIAKVMTKMDIMARVNGGGTGGGGTGSVPEPSIIALLGLGLVGIGAARRMRKKAR